MTNIIRKLDVLSELLNTHLDRLDAESADQVWCAFEDVVEAVMGEQHDAAAWAESIGMPAIAAAIRGGN
jgi:hypothetical protein